MLAGIKLIPQHKIEYLQNVDILTKHIVQNQDTLLGSRRTFNARAFKVGGTAGATFNGAVTNITVVNGIITAAS